MISEFVHQTRHMSSKPVQRDRPLSKQQVIDAIIRPDRICGARMPTYPELIPTATTQCTGESTLPSNGTGQSSRWGMLLRSPIWPVWCSQDFAGEANPWAYGALWDTGLVIPNNVGSESAVAPITDLITYIPWDQPVGDDVPSVLQASQPPWNSGLIYGGIPIMARIAGVDADEAPFIYAPKGAIIVVVVYFAGTATAGSYVLSADIDEYFSANNLKNKEYKTGWLYTGNTAYLKGLLR